MSIEPESPLKFRRTKIVATLGPASSDKTTIAQLIAAGVNVFRLNMSHGTQEEHRARYAVLRAAATDAGREIGVLADLSGPKIRVGTFEHGSIRLVDEQRVTVTTRQVTGRDGLIVSQYLELAKDVVVKDRLLLDDGNLELEVLAVAGTEIECRVVHGGVLKEKKGMNLPGVKVSAPALTEKDRLDAAFACELGVDFIALSFVRRAADVRELRELVRGCQTQPLIIAKIEKPEALDVLDEIIAASDAIMVARGDLGVEVDPARVPNVQEELVDAARVAHKPVIVATQMLESMIQQARPTRAEVTDVANAVRSGADAVMLSAETAAGLHPVAAVQAMALIIQRTEAYLFAHGAFATIETFTPTAPLKTNQSEARDPDADTAIAIATARMSRELTTSAIVADARAAQLLATLSAQRPAAMIFAVATCPSERGLSCLTWGVHPVREPDTESSPLAARAASIVAPLAREFSGGFMLVVTGGSSQNA
ncbi:MAG: pyruvate kinase, partial [Myxococcales bacterium]